MSRTGKRVAKEKFSSNSSAPRKYSPNDPASVPPTAGTLARAAWRVLVSGVRAGLVVIFMMNMGNPSSAVDKSWNVTKLSPLPAGHGQEINGLRVENATCFEIGSLRSRRTGASQKLIHTTIPDISS